MEEKLRTVKKWTSWGICLNGVSVILTMVLVILCIAFSGTLDEAMGSVAEGLEQLDPDSPVSGYEALARIFAGGGTLLIYAVTLLLAIFGTIFLGLSLAAGILGIAWNRKYVSGINPEKAGRGNVIARIILNALLAAAFLSLTADSPSLFSAALLFYQIIILGTHVRCLFLIREIMKNKESFS